MLADDGVDQSAEAFAHGIEEEHGAVRYRSPARYLVSKFLRTGEPPVLAPVPGTVAGSVAAALEQAELPDPTDKALWDSLTQAVDTAYYWEEPDGLDRLAFQPEMAGPLSRIAAHIAASPLTRWWSTPIAAEQWSIQFADPLHDDDEPDRRSPARILGEWHSEAIRAERRSHADLHSDVRAAISGEWWSMPPDSLTSSTRICGHRGPVGLYLAEDSFGPEQAAATALEPGGNIYEIDSAEAFADLCRRYPLEVTASRRHDWFRVTARDGRWVIPDWRAVAEDWDAVHLTIAAYLHTAGRTVGVDGDTATVMAGWAPDATYWLTDSYRLASDHTGWTYDDDAEIWRSGSK
ncbi:hypothetical protein GCM10027344_27720 [Spelaeicoccus albus]